MAAGNKILGFAVRIANEAGDVLDEVKDDLGDVEAAAVDAGREVGSFGGKLFETAEAGGNAEQALRGVSDITGFLGDQFGLQIGPLGEWSGALAQVGGGVEALLKGGPALVGQLKSLPGAIVPAVAGTWSYVTALLAQAAAFIVANAPIILIVGGIALLVAGIILLVKNWDTITEKVPILGTAFEAVKNVVLGIKDKVLGALQAIPDFLRDHWPEIAVLISGPFAPIVILATDGFGIRSALIGAFTDVLEFLRGLPGDVLNAATEIGKAMLNGLKEGLSGTVGFVAEVGNALLSALKSMVNQFIIDPINSALEFHIGGSILGKSWGIDINPPDIPHLAAGGIVNRPTLALIGEAGPEAVVPLSGPNARGFGASITIVAIDAQSFEEWLNRGGGDVIADHLERRMSA